MIQSFINTPVALTANDSSVSFQADNIRTNSCCGCNSWLCHNIGSANYNITEGGYYEVEFHGSVSSASAGVIALQLYNDGEPIPGTLMAETIAAADDYANIGISDTIKVCCKANSTISLRSVAAVPTPSTPATPVTTQIPIIVNGVLTLKKTS